jgi:hypothetical protein
MRNSLAWLVCGLVFAVGGLATWSLTHGETPTERRDPSSGALPPAPRDSLPMPGVHVAENPPSTPSTTIPTPIVGDPAPAGDKPKLSPLQAQIDYSARRGAEWLFRMNPPKGRFIPGRATAVNEVIENDDDLRQAGAALALARAARYTADASYAARATQTILLLLDGTVTSADVDPADGKTPITLRFTKKPTAFVNRLAAAGLLVQAISELPEPQKDLLDKADELCLYLRKQQRADGSLGVAEGSAPAEGDDPEAVSSFPGMALTGLMRSQQHRPADWKTAVVRKALAYYAPWWREHKNVAFVTSQSAAYAEAFLKTGEPPFAEFVGEMNDWLCTLQYETLDPREPKWLGGFKSWAEGKAQSVAPTVASAQCAESLAEACRVARKTGDLPRYNRYTAALELSLQFLVTLQYSDANTQHFASWYRDRLVGGFHPTHMDGDLRLDYTQHALCAMVQYLSSATH